MPKKSLGMTGRYHVVLPQDLLDELNTAADARGTTTAELLRQFIRLGLLASRPGVEIILREPDKESVILLL